MRRVQSGILAFGVGANRNVTVYLYFTVFYDTYILGKVIYYETIQQYGGGGGENGVRSRDGTAGCGCVVIGQESSIRPVYRV